MSFEKGLLKEEEEIFFPDLTSLLVLTFSAPRSLFPMTSLLRKERMEKRGGKQVGALPSSTFFSPWLGVKSAQTRGEKGLPSLGREELHFPRKTHFERKFLALARTRSTSWILSAPRGPPHTRGAPIHPHHFCFTIDVVPTNQ